jgi:hypothetical protein
VKEGYQRDERGSLPTLYSQQIKGLVTPPSNSSHSILHRPINRENEKGEKGDDV